MTIQNLSKNLRKYWGSLIILIVLVAGVLALIQNQGFKYTYYHSTVVAELQNLSVEQFQAAAVLPNATRVDHEAQIIEYQQISVIDLQEMMGTELAGEVLPYISLSERIHILPNGLSLALVYLLIYLGVSVIVMGYVFLYRKLNYGRELFLKLWLGYLAVITLSIFTYLGLLSLVSGFYQLTEYSLLGLWLVGLVGLAWLFNAFLDSSMRYGDQFHSAEQFITDVNEQLGVTIKRTVTYLAIIFLGLGFALGTTIVFDLILIGLGLTFLMIELTTLPILFYKMSNRSLPKISSPSKIETESDQSPKVKKAKRKKKRNR